MEEDITKTGPVGLKGLRGLNTFKDMTDEEYAYYTSPRQAPNFLLENALSMTQPIEITTGLGLGRSRFDKSIYNLDELYHAQDIRSLNQGTLLKLGAGIGKAVTTAGTTFLDGSIGLVAGAAEAIGSIKDDSLTWLQKVSKLWDNEFSNTMREVGEKMELILPNYRTEEEESREWYLNMGTANFWADFIKLIGFTVGAFYSGSTWNAALKGLGLLKLAGTASKFGAAMSAVNEGRIEANNNSNDWYNLELKNLQDSYTELIEGVNSRPDVMESVYDSEGRFVGAQSRNIREIQELQLNYEAAKKELDDRKAKMGLVILGVNVPLLMADNLLTWGKLYQRGFESSKRVSARQVTDNLTDEAKKLLKKDAKKLAAKEIADEELGKLVKREGKKYIWEDLKTKDALITGAKDFFREGGEEMNQMWTSTGAGIAYLYDSPDAYYIALTDPDAEIRTKGFVEGVTQGFMNSYGDLSKWLEFVMGGLTGLLGMPTFGKTLNSSASTWIGKGKSVGISGGVIGAFTENKHLNEVGKKAVQGMNDFIEKYGQETATRARHFVASNAFTDAMNGAAALGDAFTWHNVNDNEDFNIIDSFASVGKLLDYKDIVNQDFENISDEELIKLAETTRDTQTGKLLWENADGTSMASTKEDRDLMRKELAEKRDKILKGIDKYELYLGEMRAISGIQDNDDAVRELAWLKWKINRFDDRKEQLTNSSKDLLEHIISALEVHRHSYQEEINKLGVTKDTNEEDSKLSKWYENELKLTTDIQNAIRYTLNSPRGTMIPFTEEGLDYITSETFYEDVKDNINLTYDEYQKAITAIKDLDKLNSLSKVYKDRLDYYLNDSKPIKHKPKAPKKPTTAQAAQTAMLTGTPISLVQSALDALGETVVTSITRHPVQDEVKPESTYSNLTEAKIEGEHQHIEEGRATERSVIEATKLKADVESLTNASSYHSFIEDGTTEDNPLFKKLVDAIIDDLATTNPNHPAVQARKIDLALDIIYNRFNNTTPALDLKKFERLWGTDVADRDAAYQYIKAVADNSATLEEFLNPNNPAWSPEAMSQRNPLDLSSVPEVTRAAITLSYQVSMNAESLSYVDLINQVRNDMEISESLANSDNDTTDISTVTPDVDLLLIINGMAKRGSGRSLIIQELVKLGTDLDTATLQVDYYIAHTSDNDGTSANFEGIELDYKEEDIITTSTKEDDLIVLIPTEERLPKNYSFFKVNTTEYPTPEDIRLHRTQYEEKGWVINGKFDYSKFNYDEWVDLHENWSEELRKSLKVRHRILEERGAYTRIRHGELLGSQSDKPTELSFVTYKDINQEANDLIVFITDLNGNILGDLASPLDATSMSAYPGLKQFLQEMSDGSKKGNQDYTYPVKSHVDKIMVGRPSYTASTRSIGVINPNLQIGVITTKSTGNIATSTKDEAPKIDNTNILKPLNPKRGLVYVMVPNSRLGTGIQGYTPVLCTVKSYNQEVSGAIIALKMRDLITRLSTSTTYNDIVKAFMEIGDYLYIPNIHMTLFSGNTRITKENATLPITHITFSELDVTGNYSDIAKVNINSPSILEEIYNKVLKDKPFYVNLRILNTEEGKKMYNEIVLTNLAEGTETTINDWFTFNPIINGKELNALSPTSTKTNPTIHLTTLQLTTIEGKTYEVDPKEIKIYSNGVEVTPISVDNPEHLTSGINRKLAEMFVNNHPEVNKVNGIAQTPYGWYDTTTNSLVNKPESQEPIILGSIKRKPITPTLNDPNVLGTVTINSKEVLLTKNDLLDALDNGYGLDLTPESDIKDIAKAVEDAGLYRLATTLKEKIWDREKELAWLDKVLPNLLKEDRVQLVLGLIDDRAWGKFQSGIITLSNDRAAEGTTYHEAFHVVSRTLLTDLERDKMYEAAKKKFGDKPIDLLEEDLAEDFRVYTQQNIIPEDNLLKRLFRKLKNFINTLFTKPNILDKLYYDINQGVYANRAMHIRDGIAYMWATVNQAELDEIKAKTIADDTFMKAPNGNPTNLSEHQWLQVRTQAFKDWFGDWEALAQDRAELNRIPNLRRINTSSFVRAIQEHLEKNFVTSGFLNREAVSVLSKLFDLNSIELYQGDVKSGGLSIYSGAVVIGNHSLEDAAEVFTHEVLHNFTTYAYDSNPEFKKEMDRFHRIALNHNKGFSEDVYEFMANTLEKNHMNALSEIPSPNSAEKNLLKSIVNNFVKYIRSYFKNNVNRGNRTLFNDIIESIYRNQRPNSDSKNSVSKVVDENGEPLVVYHGSSENIKEFNYEGDRKWNPGFFFTSDKNYAKNISNVKGGDIQIPVFLNIKNPIITNTELVSKEIEGIYIKEGNRGSDGIIGKDKYTGEFKKSNGIEFVVTNPNQIKSATDNIGTFSTEDNSIYYRLAEDVYSKEAILLSVNSLVNNAAKTKGSRTKEWYKLVKRYRNEGYIVKGHFDDAISAKRWIVDSVKSINDEYLKDDIHHLDYARLTPEILLAIAELYTEEYWDFVLSEEEKREAISCFGV